jgi:hypothetical protein
VTMPVSVWARRAATLPAALVQATPRAVRAGGVVLEDQAERNLRTATGGDLRLSRVRSGKGARVGVQVRVVGAGSRSTAVVTPTGPVSLVEEDTRRHVEPFTYAGTTGAGGRRRYATRGQRMASGDVASRRRARRAGVIYVPGYGPRTRVQHPGTRGKHPVRDAFREAAGSAGRAGGRVFADAIADHLT